MTVADDLLASPHRYAALPRVLVERQGATVPGVLVELVAAGRCGVVARRSGIEVTEVCLQPARHRVLDGDGRATRETDCDLPANRKGVTDMDGKRRGRSPWAL